MMLKQTLIKAAETGAAVMKSYFNGKFEISNKEGINNLVTEADHASEKAIFEIIKNDFPDLFIINQPVNEVVNLSKQFQLKDEIVMASNRLYIVDPLGHLMMSYQSPVPLADVRKDLIRLLRYSWAG